MNVEELQVSWNSCDETLRTTGTSQQLVTLDIDWYPDSDESIDWLPDDLLTGNTR